MKKRFWFQNPLFWILRGVKIIGTAIVLTIFAGCLYLSLGTGWKKDPLVPLVMTGMVILLLLFSVLPTKTK